MVKPSESLRTVLLAAVDREWAEDHAKEVETAVEASWEAVGLVEQFERLFDL